MPDVQVNYKHGVTLIGGGPVTNPQLSTCLTRAPTLVAADGGADQAAALGRSPSLIIGDLDSIVNHETWRESGIRIIECVEQNTTDFEKCLYTVNAPYFLACGFTGGRLDHQLAALSALLGYPDKKVILVGDRDLCFLCPPRLEVTLAPGTRMSLMPLGPVVGQESRGLRWSVKGLNMAPGGRIGTSNAVEGPVSLAFDHQKVLVLVPPDQLDPVLAGLGVDPRPAGRKPA